MVGNNTPSKIRVRHKHIVWFAATALTTVLLIAFLVFPLINKGPEQPANGWLVGLLLSLTLFIAILTGYGLSHTFNRRLNHILEVSRAWLRGSLSVRIEDPLPDDLGLLAENLDQLASHLEEDEEDLNRLSQSNTRLTDQVRALAVVEERNRLARELHDSVKQHLFSLAMTASAIKARFESLDNIPEDVKEMAIEIVNASQSAQRETTRLIEDLRPGSLEEQGLAGALNDYTLLFGAQEHLLVYLDVHCNDKTLPPAVAEALYRVAQESLHNVARHAHATRVDVEVQCVDNHVILRIEDNGVGFDTTRAHQGMGVSNMQERLLGVGGKLIIDSHHSIGTTVRAEVQLRPQQELQIQKTNPAQEQANFHQWLWLGEKLVIPVGQTWPWLPEDEERHLAEPTIMPHTSPLTIRKERGFLALRTQYTVRSAEQRYPLCRIHGERSGYTWDSNTANWDLHHFQGLYGRSVLLRNGQPLAALQYQGRQMNTWTEIVYRTQTFNLVYGHGNKDCYTLMDSQGQNYGYIHKSEMTININRPIPLPLLAMAVTRFLDETSIANPVQDETPSGKMKRSTSIRRPLSENNKVQNPSSYEKGES